MADFFHVSLDMFFDRAKVIDAMDRKTHRVLSSTGAFGRSVMQRGMRYRKKASTPGDYPSARRGNALLRDGIFFGYNASAREVVVGPRLLDRTDSDVAAMGKTVPQLINEGGVVSRRMVYDAKKKQMRRTNRPLRWRYRPRPFVDLTLPKAAAKLAENMEKFDLT